MARTRAKRTASTAIKAAAVQAVAERVPETEVSTITDAAPLAAPTITPTDSGTGAAPVCRHGVTRVRQAGRGYVRYCDDCGVAV